MTKTERIRQLEEKVKALELRIALMEASKQPTYAPPTYIPYLPLPWAPPLLPPQPIYPTWTWTGRTGSNTLPPVPINDMTCGMH